MATLELHHAVAERLGIAPQDLAALVHLGRDGALTPTALRTRLKLRAASVTAVVDRLERRGLAQRRPHPDDRRSTLVELTPGGLDRARAELAPMIDAVTASGQRLSAAERATVQAYLEEATKEMLGLARYSAPPGLPTSKGTSGG